MLNHNIEQFNYTFNQDSIVTFRIVNCVRASDGCVYVCVVIKSHSICSMVRMCVCVCVWWFAVVTNQLIRCQSMCCRATAKKNFFYHIFRKHSAHIIRYTISYQSHGKRFINIQNIYRKSAVISLRLEFSCPNFVSSSRHSLSLPFSICWLVNVWISFAMSSIASIHLQMC